MTRHNVWSTLGYHLTRTLLLIIDHTHGTPTT